MSVNSNNSSGGVSFLGLLTVAFIVLKLTNVINWSWWWVLLPLYGGILIAIAILLVIYIFARIRKW